MWFSFIFFIIKLNKSLVLLETTHNLKESIINGYGVQIEYDFWGRGCPLGCDKVIIQFLDKGFMGKGSI